VTRDKPIKGIFFDAGDTLFEAKAPIGTYYSRFAARHGLDIGAETLGPRFKEAFQKAPPLAFPDASENALPGLEYQWWRRLVGHVFSGIDFPHFDLFFDELYAFFESESAWQLFPETKSVLAALKKSGFTLGIISNFDSRLVTICRHLGIHDFFDVIVFSSQSAVAKPAPGIFKHSLKKTGLSPSESVHVGDHFENDVTGPQAVGIKALFLNRKGLNGTYKAHRSIRNLHGIHAFLKKR